MTVTAGALHVKCSATTLRSPHTQTHFRQAPRDVFSRWPSHAPHSNCSLKQGEGPLWLALWRPRRASTSSFDPNSSASVQVPSASVSSDALSDVTRGADA